MPNLISHIFKIRITFLQYCLIRIDPKLTLRSRSGFPARVVSNVVFPAPGGPRRSVILSSSITFHENGENLWNGWPMLYIFYLGKKDIWKVYREGLMMPLTSWRIVRVVFLDRKIFTSLRNPCTITPFLMRSNGEMLKLPISFLPHANWVLNLKTDRLPLELGAWISVLSDLCASLRGYLHLPRFEPLRHNH